MEDITIELFTNETGKRVTVLKYVSDGDPVASLEKKVKEYTTGKQYSEFIDMNMDNPWVRVIIFGD